MVCVIKDSLQRALIFCNTQFFFAVSKVNEKKRRSFPRSFCAYVNDVIRKSIRNRGIFLRCIQNIKIDRRCQKLLSRFFYVFFYINFNFGGNFFFLILDAKKVQFLILKIYKFCVLDGIKNTNRQMGSSNLFVDFVHLINLPFSISRCNTTFFLACNCIFNLLL